MSTFECQGCGATLLEAIVNETGNVMAFDANEPVAHAGFTLERVGPFSSERGVWVARRARVHNPHHCKGKRASK